MRRGRCYRGAWLDVFVLDAGISLARLGLVIPKRLGRRANVRNGLKRQIRESFRLRAAKLPHHDIVVRWSRTPMSTDKAAWTLAIRADIDAVLDRLVEQHLTKIA